MVWASDNGADSTYRFPAGDPDPFGGQLRGSSGAFLKSLAAEPPIKPGTPDPYSPPEPGELRPEEHLQIGPITQYVTSLTKSHDEPPESHHGLDHAAG